VNAPPVTALQVSLRELANKRWSGRAICGLCSAPRTWREISCPRRQRSVPEPPALHLSEEPRYEATWLASAARFCWSASA